MAIIQGKNWLNSFKILCLLSIFVFTLFIVLFSHNAFSKSLRQASIPTLSSIAQVRNRPQGVPLAGDIIMRTLYYHNGRKPKENPKMNVLEAVDAFFVNRLEWVYGLPEIDRASLTRLKQKIDYFSAAINSNVDNKNYAAKDIAGNNIATAILGPEHYVGDMAKPSYYQHVLSELNSLIIFLKDKQKIPIIQRDDYQGNYRMLNAPSSAHNKFGSFSPEMIEAFKKYAQTNIDIKDYLDTYLIDNNLSPNIDLRTLIYQDATIKKFVEFTEQLTIDFYQKLRADAVEPFLFSMNGGLNWNAIEQNFDYGFAEIRDNHCTPTFFHEIDRGSRALNKFNVLTMPKSPFYQVAENYNSFVRTCIATSYASGIPMMVPWDVYMPNLPDGQKVDRYFGETKDYQDIYKFIHYNRKLFDRYEDAFVTGYIDAANAYWSKMNGKPYGELQDNVTISRQYFTDRRYQNNPPIVINQPYFYAYARAVPNQNNKPAVIHLVNWTPPKKNQPAKLQLTLNPERFFSNRSYKVELLLPDVNQKNGTKKVLLSQGRPTTVTIDLEKYPLQPWGIVVVSQTNNLTINRVNPPYLKSPVNNLCDRNCKVALESSNPNNTIYYRFGDRINSKWQKYDGELSLTRTAVLESKASDGRNWSKPTQVRLRKYRNHLVDSSVVNSSELKYVSAEDIIDSENAKFRFNRSILGGKLQIKDKKYERGISLRQVGNVESSSISLRVPSGYDYLSMDIGVDRKSIRKPSFRIVIAANGQYLYETPIFNLSEEKIQEYQRKKFSLNLKIPQQTDILKAILVKEGMSSYDNVAVLGDIYFAKTNSSVDH